MPVESVGDASSEKPQIQVLDSVVDDDDDDEIDTHRRNTVCNIIKFHQTGYVSALVCSLVSLAEGLL